MTENTPAAGDSVSDSLIVRGRPPFAMTPTSLPRNPAVSSHAVRLWSVLASYTYGDQATDRPSRSRLAADVGWKSPRSVDTYLTELQDAGYLTVERRWRPDGGKARNLHILEWEPQNPSTSGRADGPGTQPVDDSDFAARTHAQNPAHGGAAGVGTSVDDSVGAGQPHAQDPAHAVMMPATHEQDSARPHEQNPAHLGKELKPKKNQPPTNPPLVTSGDHGRPRTTRADVQLPGGPEQVDDFVDVIRRALPDRLRVQLSTSTLRARAEALARAGWTEHALAAAVTNRAWDGARAGAVITWLTDLTSHTQPRPAARDDPRIGTLRRRVEVGQARATAAGQDSPSRVAARQLASQLGRHRH